MCVMFSFKHVRSEICMSKFSRQLLKYNIIRKEMRLCRRINYGWKEYWVAKWMQNCWKFCNVDRCSLNMHSINFTNGIKLFQYTPYARSKLVASIMKWSNNPFNGTNFTSLLWVNAQNGTETANQMKCDKRLGFMSNFAAYIDLTKQTCARSRPSDMIMSYWLLLFVTTKSDCDWILVVK